MKIQVQKWGNSLALRIPKSFAVETKVVQGSTVELTIEGENLVVKPVTSTEYDLGELLAGVTKRNIHSEIGTGSPTGGEVW